MRPPNAFGFDTRQNPVHQLLEFLSISPSSKAAKDIRTRLRKLTKQHLDIERSPSQQGSVFLKLKKDLPNLFPNLFNPIRKGSQNLKPRHDTKAAPKYSETGHDANRLTYILLRAIASFHHNARAQWRAQSLRREQRRLAAKGRSAGAQQGEGGRVFLMDVKEIESEAEDEGMEGEEEGRKDDKKIEEDEDEFDLIQIASESVSPSSSFEVSSPEPILLLPQNSSTRGPTTAPLSRSEYTSSYLRRTSTQNPEPDLHLDDFPRIIEDDSPSPAAFSAPAPRLFGMTLRSSSRRGAGAQTSLNRLDSTMPLAASRHRPVLGDITAKVNVGAGVREANSKHKGRIKKRPYTYDERSEQPQATLTPLSSSRVSISLSAPSSTLSDSNGAIQTFLSSCQPPLTHLLPNFITYGCTSEAYLRALAAFPGPKRRKVLKRVLGSPDREDGKAGVKEFDLDLLEEQFERDF